LIAINRSKLSLLIGPFVPDTDTILLKITDIGFAFQEPEQFVDDRPEVKLLGGKKGKTFGKVKTHLISESADSTGTGPVFFPDTNLQNMIQ
jgi:hypothetical protein